MMGAANPAELIEHLMQADEFGVKLEIVQDNYVWEFFPSPAHQAAVQAVYDSVKPVTGSASDGCGCYRLMDAYVKFADGSVKRPDLMIFCERPSLSRQALDVVPQAVVEVLSPGTEKKDLDIGPPFYLSQGVHDVVVLNPETGVVHHFRRDGVKRLEGPTTLQLECGCVITA